MKRLHSFLVSMVALSLAGVLAACNHEPTKPPVQGISEAGKQKAFADVSFYRNQAESRIKSAKSQFNNYEKKDEALGAIEKAYSAAAGRGNAFIEIVQLNLTAKVFSETTLEPHVAEVKKAFDQMDSTVEGEFKKRREFLEKKTGMKSSVSAITIENPIESTLVGLAKAGVVIWQAAQAAKKEAVEDIKKELDKRRWREWSQIKFEE